jgi:hypothetical protein
MPPPLPPESNKKNLPSEEKLSWIFPMHPLYSEATQLLKKLKEKRLEVAQLSSQIAQQDYQLTLTRTKIERGLIKKVGDEKKLAPSADSRERIFILARDADSSFLQQHQHLQELKLMLENAKIEILYFQEQIALMQIAMKIEKPSPEKP